MGTITYSAYHCVIYPALKRYKQDYDALNLETIGEKIYNDLKELIGRRNAITHCKPQVIIDDAIALKGNLPIKYKKSHEFMDSCMSLPKRLVDHLGKFDKSIHIDHLQSSMVDFITMSNEEIAVQKYVSEWASNRKKTDGV